MQRERLHCCADLASLHRPDSKPWSEGFQLAVPCVGEAANLSIPLPQSLSVGRWGKCVTSGRWLSAAEAPKELLTGDCLLTTLPAAVQKVPEEGTKLFHTGLS